MGVKKLPWNSCSELIVICDVLILLKGIWIGVTVLLPVDWLFRCFDKPIF